MTAVPQDFRGIAERAVALVRDGSVIGLGTGHAAAAFLHVLGEHVRAGLRVRGVPTSQASADLAGQLGIPLTTFEEFESLDIDVDGADEVDPNCNLIKGLGGALVREKIVASAARQLVILVGPEKLVPVLGSHGILPVEVVPFALPVCRRRLEKLGFPGKPRMHGGALFVSDNGNYILDCAIPPLERPVEVEQTLRAIPGVVDTGLFLGMANTVLIQEGDKVQVRQGAV
jgi:ribose 5-phosphate isomerase A